MLTYSHAGAMIGHGFEIRNFLLAEDGISSGMAAGLHISISAEKILEVGGFAVTNSIFTSLIATTILIVFSLLVHKQISGKKALSAPSGLQNIFEMIVEALYNLTRDVAGSDALTRTIFPLAASFFFWILVNNWIGLIPGNGTIGITEEPHAVEAAKEVFAADVVDEHGSTTLETTDARMEPDSDHESAVTYEEGDHVDEAHEEEGHSIFVPIFRAGTADLNTTLALALISVFATQAIGIKKLGLSYFKKFFNLKSPIDAFIGLIEMISEVSKIISYAFRLFGNIFAGEVLLAVVAFISPLVIKPFSTVPFLMLEVFVGVVQALVFAMLTIVFMSMATISHDEH